MSARFAAMALNNPRVRSLAKQAARFAARGVTRRVVQRRRRRNRRILVPYLNNRFGGRRNTVQAGRRLTTGSAVPVRTTTQTSFSGKEETVIDQEPMNYNLIGYVDDKMHASVFDINPTNAEIWPRLAQRAWNFVEWDIQQFVVDYTPAVGSAFNGVVQVAFTPQTGDSNPLYDNAMEVDSLPDHTAFTASSPATFAVNTTNFSQKGQGLFMDVNNTQEPTRYYGGKLIIRSYNCDSDALLGRFTVRYYVRLKRPITLTTYHNALYTLSSAETKPGRHAFEYDAAALTGTYVSMGPMYLMVRTLDTGGAPDLTCVSDGTDGPRLRWIHNIFPGHSVHIFPIYKIGRVGFTLTAVDIQVLSLRVCQGDSQLEPLPSP